MLSNTSIWLVKSFSFRMGWFAEHQQWFPRYSRSLCLQPKFETTSLSKTRTLFRFFRNNKLGLSFRSIHLTRQGMNSTVSQFCKSRTNKCINFTGCNVRLNLCLNCKFASSLENPTQTKKNNLFFRVLDLQVCLSFLFFLLLFVIVDTQTSSTAFRNLRMMNYFLSLEFGSRSLKPYLFQDFFVNSKWEF